MALNNIIFFLLLFVFLFSCQKQGNNSVSNIVEGTPLTYSQLIGKRLECNAPQGKADVYMIAPHMLAIMSVDPDYILEYYRTDFLSKDGELYFQLAFLGRGDYKTKSLPPEDNNNRRIKLSFKDKKVKIFVAQALDEKRNPVMANEMDCQIAGVLENFFVPPELIEKAKP